MNRDEKNAEGLSVPGIDRTKGASAFLTRSKIANRFASVNGGELDRRPVSILSAEIVLWLLAVLVVLFCADWIGRGPFDLAKISLLSYIVWRVSLPVLVHYGFRLIATLGMIVELGLWPGFCRYGIPWDGHLALCGTHLLPLVLLWLPPSIRWSARRNLKRRKNEGARTDSHPENPEDGSKAPFTDNKIALYLSCVNRGWK